MIRYTIGCAVLAVCTYVGGATAQQGGISPEAAAERQHIGILRLSVDRKLERKCIRNPYRPYQYPRVGAIPADRLRPIRKTWQSRERRAIRRASRCGVTLGRAAELRRWFRTSGAACVKAREGAWTSNTGNGYYGGFQADRSFQRAYGLRHFRRWGTANYWPPIAQIDMAHRGWQARGWYPWPNTARMCGLL